MRGDAGPASGLWQGRFPLAAGAAGAGLAATQGGTGGAGRGCAAPLGLKLGSGIARPARPGVNGWPTCRGTRAWPGSEAVGVKGPACRRARPDGEQAWGGNDLGGPPKTSKGGALAVRAGLDRVVGVVRACCRGRGVHLWPASYTAQRSTGGPCRDKPPRRGSLAVRRRKLVGVKVNTLMPGPAKT